LAAIDRVSGKRNRTIVVVRAALAWMVANPVATGAVVVLLLAAGAWASLETFYRDLGTTPQEVGNGVVSQPVIAGTLIGVLLTLGAAVALYALMFMAYTYWSAFRDAVTMIAWVHGRKAQSLAAVARRRWVRGTTLAREFIAIIVTSVVVLAVAAMFSFYPTQAEAMARHVSEGHATVGMYLGQIDVLPVRAVPVDIARLGGATQSYDNRCLMLLGSSDGTTVLYDASRDTSVRMPSSTVEVVGDEHSASACQALVAKRSPNAPAGADLRVGFAVVVGVVGTALLVAGAWLLVLLTRAPFRATGAKTGRIFVIANMSVGAGLVALGVLVAAGVGLLSLVGIVLALYLVLAHTVLYTTYQASV
jgi:hypothetical protein